jgi:hypothetical protein
VAIGGSFRLPGYARVLPDLFVLFGGVGLVLGLALGYGFRRWKVAVGLVLVAAIAVPLLIRSARDPTCLDDCPHAYLGLVVLLNFAGWAFGLSVGTGVGKVASHRR